MIRVELGEEVRRHARWRWKVSGTMLEGVSRQPLLDACRELERTGVDTAAQVGMFWSGKDQPSLTCSVGTGAGLTVDENRTAYAKWKAYNP